MTSRWQPFRRNILRNGTIVIVLGGATARFWDGLSGWPLAGSVAADVLQIAWAKHAEPSLFFLNPAVHTGASDVTPH
jgi:hypothetical protein